MVWGSVQRWMGGWMDEPTLSHPWFRGVLPQVVRGVFWIAAVVVFDRVCRAKELDSGKTSPLAVVPLESGRGE